jgi:hypothetical protein
MRLENPVLGRVRPNNERVGVTTAGTAIEGGLKTYQAEHDRPPRRQASLTGDEKVI